MADAKKPLSLGYRPGGTKRKQQWPACLLDVIELSEEVDAGVYRLGSVSSKLSDVAPLLTYRPPENGKRG